MLNLNDGEADRPGLFLLSLLLFLPFALLTSSSRITGTRMALDAGEDTSLLYE